MSESEKTTPQPAGWQLVPIEPTQEMIQAMATAWSSCVNANDPNEGVAEYRAMLAAAPAARAQSVNAPNWVSLTDEDRNRAMCSMPDMLDGFLKTWGWLHFAKAIEAECRAKNGGTE
jgi:hypothetical protein